jgi:hypothetical protein
MKHSGNATRSGPAGPRRIPHLFFSHSSLACQAVALAKVGHLACPPRRVTRHCFEILNLRSDPRFVRDEMRSIFARLGLGGDFWDPQSDTFG